MIITRRPLAGGRELKNVIMAPSKRKGEKASLNVIDALESMESGTVKGRTEGVAGKLLVSIWQPILTS